MVTLKLVLHNKLIYRGRQLWGGLRHGPMVKPPVLYVHSEFPLWLKVLTILHELQHYVSWWICDYRYGGQSINDYIDYIDHNLSIYTRLDEYVWTRWKL